MKQRIKFIFTTWFIAISLFTINAQDVQTNKNDMENLNLTNEWDKTFPQSDKVKHSKVTFRNRYGITLAADLYMPKNAEGKLPAIAVCGPFGAVKEQASGLYANYGRTRLSDNRLRPLFHRRKRRRTSLRGITRHKYGRFLCSRRFPLLA